jgi:hypothetical protein
VAEQLEDAFPGDNEDIVDAPATDLPIEANEADVAEQRIKAPDALDDDADEP